MPTSTSTRPEEVLDAAEAALAQGAHPALDGLDLAPPRLDPDEPRRSGAELCFLAAALGHRIAQPAQPELQEGARVGYRNANLNGVPVAWPAFAQALAQPTQSDLRTEFPDLWRLDAGLWSALPSSNPRELARAWLSSPGRRLLQDLNLLKVLARPDTSAGAADLSWARLCAASGATGIAAPPPAFLAVHLAWPGGRLAAWRPVDVADALFTLEQGSPAHARGGALCWLLDRAATDPVVSVVGVLRHLREELPARLAVAFSSDTPSARAARRAADVEQMCLAHAARIARAHGQEGEVEATWHLARWIQTVTMASPFYGGDPESLTARLRALLPATTTAPELAPPPLAPAHFGAPERSEIEVTEHAWVSAAATHYGESELTLRPVPEPLLERLRAVASRPLTPAEWAIERALAGSDAPSVAPPMLARSVLSDRIRAQWLKRLEPTARAELVKLASTLPARTRWLALAALDDGDALDDVTQRDLLALWRDPTALAGWEPEERASLGLGLARSWAVEDEQMALHLLSQLSIDMKIPLLKHFSEIPTLKAEGSRREVVQALLQISEADAEEPTRRIDALGDALHLIVSSKDPDRGAQLDRVRRLAERRPFRDSVPLRRELRRLGVGGA